MNGDLVYAEGPFIGYRGYVAHRAAAPLFWFGHGLGYSTFEWTEFALTDHDVSDPGVTLVVRNTGSRESREVVQVYYRPDDDSQPVRLAGWSAVTVAPGESAPVTVSLDKRVLRRWDTDANTWAHLTGGELLVARSLADIRATLPLPTSR